MDDGHVRNAEEVMAYLAQKARSEWTMRQHRECLAGLAEHLRERGLGYSEDAAWEWPEGIAGGLDKTRRSSHVGALAKLGDTCATGETGSFHHGAPKKEDRPCGRHKRLVDDCRACLRGSGLAPATVGNHRAAATRFLLDPRRGVRGGRVLRRPDSHPPGVRGHGLSRQDMPSGHDEVASGPPSLDRPGQARARADGRRHGAEERPLPGPRRPGDRRGPSRLPSRRRRGHRARGLPRPRRRPGGRAPRARPLANRHPRGLPLRQLAVPVHGRRRSALRPAGRPRMAGIDGGPAIGRRPPGLPQGRDTLGAEPRGRHARSRQGRRPQENAPRPAARTARVPGRRVPRDEGGGGPGGVDARHARGVCLPPPHVRRRHRRRGLRRRHGRARQAPRREGPARDPRGQEGVRLAHAPVPRVAQGRGRAVGPPPAPRPAEHGGAEGDGGCDARPERAARARARPRRWRWRVLARQGDAAAGAADGRPRVGRRRPAGRRHRLGRRDGQASAGEDGMRGGPSHARRRRRRGAPPRRGGASGIARGIGAPAPRGAARPARRGGRTAVAAEGAPRQEHPRIGLPFPARGPRLEHASGRGRAGPGSRGAGTSGNRQRAQVPVTRRGEDAPSRDRPRGERASPGGGFGDGRQVRDARRAGAPRRWPACREGAMGLPRRTGGRCPRDSAATASCAGPRGPRSPGTSSPNGPGTARRREAATTPNAWAWPGGP